MRQKSSKSIPLQRVALWNLGVANQLEASQAGWGASNWPPPIQHVQKLEYKRMLKLDAKKMQENVLEAMTVTGQ